jgi:thioredoxin 1
MTPGACQANSKPKAAAKTASKTSKPAAKQIRWLTSLETALQESQRTGKPILADFNATWCPPCKIMKQTTFPNAQVIAESQRWIMLDIDVDKQPSVAAQYRISSMPTLAVLTPKGEPITGIMGYAGPAELVQMMRENYKAATTAK